MELLLGNTSTIGSLIVATLVMSIIYLFCMPSFFSKWKFPPGPRRWPVLGNMPVLLSDPAHPHRTLATVALHYGPIFTLWMGSAPALVVSSPSMAKEFLRTHDKIFSDRPKMGMSDALQYGQDNGLGLAHYGPKWRALRKIFSLELLTQKRLDAYADVRHEEVAGMIQYVERKSKEGEGHLDVRRCVSTVIGNILARLVFSIRLVDWTTGAHHELKDVIYEANRMIIEVLIGDYIPWLGKWMDKRTVQKMRKVHHKVDTVLSNFISNRLKEAKDGRAPDFLDVLLAKTEVNELKSVLMDLFQAGLDSSSSVVEWTMAELLRHPEKMKKLKAEIDEAVGGEIRLVRESEAAKLPYLKAVVKEVLRIHPPIPLMIPHQAQEECMFTGGYKVPPNTRLLVNIWAIGTDPTLWDQPHEFIPERFLNNPIDILGHDYELLPFGSGRRMCPGLPLALHVVSLTLVNLVHNFDWDCVGLDLDMSDKIDGTLVMSTPLRTIAKPRVASVVPT